MKARSNDDLTTGDLAMTPEDAEGVKGGGGLSNRAQGLGEVLQSTVRGTVRKVEDTLTPKTKKATTRKASKKR